VVGESSIAGDVSDAQTEAGTDSAVLSGLGGVGDDQLGLAAEQCLRQGAGLEIRVALEVEREAAGESDRALEPALQRDPSAGLVLELPCGRPMSSPAPKNTAAGSST